MLSYRRTRCGVQIRQSLYRDAQGAAAHGGSQTTQGNFPLRGIYPMAAAICRINRDIGQWPAVDVPGEGRSFTGRATAVGARMLNEEGMQ